MTSAHCARGTPRARCSSGLAKETGNSLYGKLAQGIYPDGAEARDGGIVPGRAASGKRVFNSRRGSLERIPPSKITQALLAAYVTGLCRAVLGELVARLPAEVTLATATTDGLLIDGGLRPLEPPRGRFVPIWPNDAHRLQLVPLQRIRRKRRFQLEGLEGLKDLPPIAQFW